MSYVRAILAILLLCAAYGAGAIEADPELREALRAAANDAPSFTDRFDAEVWLVDMSARLE